MRASNDQDSNAIQEERKSSMELDNQSVRQNLNESLFMSERPVIANRFKLGVSIPRQIDSQEV